MITWIKKLLTTNIAKSFFRNISSRVIAWLSIIGVAPDLATSFWANTTAVAIILAEYLFDQYMSVKDASKK
jgi:hypothetical protein